MAVGRGQSVRSAADREVAVPRPPRWFVPVLASTIVAAAAVLHCTGLGDIPFHTKGEPREAIAVQDLLASGRIVLPLRNGYEMPRKPPLFYWLGAAVSAVSGGVDERSVRLPSALQSCAAALLLLLAGTARGRPLLGFFAALVLLSSFEWSRSATGARIDMTLALGMTASFVGLTLLDRRPRKLGLCLLYGGMIWGTLAKGPIGIVLPTLCMGVVTLLEAGPRWVLAGLAVCLLAVVGALADVPTRTLIGLGGLAAVGFVAALGVRGMRRLAPQIGYPVVLVVVGAWYALAARAGGSEFIELQILAENFGRFLGTSRVAVGHAHGPGYLVGAFVGGFMPWVLFLPAAVASATLDRDRATRSLLVHSAVWMTVVLAFFTVSSSKRSVYLLPLYPAASVLIGHWISQLIRTPRRHPYLSKLGAGLGLILALIGGAVATFFGLQELGLDVLTILLRPLAGLGLGAAGSHTLVSGLAGRTDLIVLFASAVALAGLAASSSAFDQRWPNFLASLFGAIFSLLLLVRLGILPAVAAADSRAAAVRGLRHTAGDREVAMTAALDYGTAFYLGGAVPVVDFMESRSTGAIIVLPRSTWRALPWSIRGAYEPIPSLSLPKQSNQVALMAVQRTLEGSP